MDIIDFDDDRAITALKNHQVIALPTETVYGLGVYWDDEEAYEKLVSCKKRRPDKAIACMCAEDFDFDSFFVLNERIKRVMKNFLPGPLTILVKAKDKAPFQSHLGTGICGIRIPDKKELLAFLKKAGKPLQVTSANLSGEPPLHDYDKVYAKFQDDNRVSCLIQGECRSAIPTSVVDLTGEEIRLVRQGEIRLEQIKEIYYGER